MNRTLLLILVLALLRGCHPTRPEDASARSHVLKEAYNPSLLTLQYLTAEIKKEKGQWARSQFDYLRAFGDTAGLILADFELLYLETLGDTLVFHYILKEPRQKTAPVVDYISPKTGMDTSTFKFDQRVQQVRHNTVCKAHEGKLIFFSG